MLSAASSGTCPHPSHFARFRAFDGIFPYVVAPMEPVTDELMSQTDECEVVWPGGVEELAA